MDPRVWGGGGGGGGGGVFGENGVKSSSNYLPIARADENSFYNRHIQQLISTTVNN